MMLKCKDGYELEGFKIRDIVQVAIGQMKILTDFKNPDSYYTHSQFAELCLKVLCFELKCHTTLKLKHLEDSETWIKSCKREYHIRKMQDLTLRSFRSHGDGSIFIRYMAGTTNPENVRSLDIQARDFIAVRINKYNDRVVFDQKQLGIDGKLALPNPN